MNVHNSDIFVTQYLFSLSDRVKCDNFTFSGFFFSYFETCNNFLSFFFMKTVSPISPKAQG